MFRSMARPTLACVVTVLLVCGLPAPGAAQWRAPSLCTTTTKNLFVRDVLSDIYFWYTELPDVNPALYASPEAYLDAVRFRPLDEHFSYITSRASNEAFYGASQYVGLGVSWTIRGRELRVLQVFPESPASEAGLARGDRVTAIGGRPIAELIEGNLIDAVVGAAEIGLSVRLDFTDRAGTPRTATMVKRIVTIPTVALTRAFEVQGRRVGYIFFRNFVEPSPAALDEAFAQLAEARIDDLVLDLRYNGGGLVSVAQHLASVIGGVRARGQVFAEFFHNDKNAHRNEIMRFEEKPNAATLNRLVVIATPSSASASELVINALRPFMPVVVIGDRTYGKPVGQYQVNFCDKTLAPVSFTLRNANGEGDFFNGFAPDCPAPDDVEHELGDAAEGSLREALTFVATGACSPAFPGLQRVAPERRDTRARGWQAIINAY
jgi:carboxyl-terminal processing protease